MADNFFQPSIPHFDGHYDHWDTLIENFLRSKEYWQVVSEGIQEPEDVRVVTKVWKKEIEGFLLKDLKEKIIFSKAIDH